MITILLLSFFVFLVLRLPIAVALGLSSLIALAWSPMAPVPVVAQRMFVAIDSFPLMAVPLYMLAGYLMGAGGISRRIVDFAASLVGGLTGGLAHVTVVASMIFGGISGSAVADTAAIGTIMIPEMKQRGYPAAYAAAVTAVASTLGVVIPPSIPMVIIGAMLGVSVGRLFLGGVLPGALIGLALMSVVYLAERRRRDSAGRSTFRPAGSLWHAVSRAGWALLMPVIVIVSIVSGIVTVTEAGALAVVYALAVATLIYRELSLADLSTALLNTVESTARVFFLIATAGLYSWLLTANGFPEIVGGFLTSWTDNPTLVLILIAGVLLLITTFMESIAAMVLLLPILYPVALQVGVDPIHFGVVVVMSVGVGLVTPPVGLCMFVAADIADAGIGTTVKRMTPFLAAMTVLLLGCILFPAIITVVPDMILP